MRIRITKLQSVMNDQTNKCRVAAPYWFVIRASFGIRHSAFVICRNVLLAVIAQTCCSALAQGQTPNMTGTWNVEITFANERHRFLRFDAHDGGKGTLTVTDPQSKVWVGDKASEAKWSRGEGNSVKFSGPVEFLLGNVGRDAGTLTCEGKFETADLISGDAEFSPSVGDRPSKHGSFKAVRSGT